MVKFFIYFVLTYVVALCLQLLKWVHLPSNSSSSYFMANLHRKIARKLSNFLKNLSSLQKMVKKAQKWAQCGLVGRSKKRCVGIFKILIFYPIFGGGKSEKRRLLLIFAIIYYVQHMPKIKKIQNLTLDPIFKKLQHIEPIMIQAITVNDQI